MKNSVDIKSLYVDAKPGESITFGTYPHNSDGSDNTPITWRVLHNSGDELFILSEHLLECKRYHGKSNDIKWRDCVDMSWHDCDLREWLNDDFYHNAFHTEEKELIQLTHCNDNGVDCPDTLDHVFLLSVAEIKELSKQLGKDILRAIGTDFAKEKKIDGCNLYVYDKSNKDDYMIKNGEEVGCSWWWLRTQGNKPSRVYFIGTGCSIRSYGNNSINGYGVRPALKIKIQ